MSFFFLSFFFFFFFIFSYIGKVILIRERNITLKEFFQRYNLSQRYLFVVFVVLLFYVHGKHLRSCRDGQLT